MHLYAITALKEVEEHLGQFYIALESEETRIRRVGNRSQADDYAIYVHRDLGIWTVLETHSSEQQTWNVFGITSGRFAKESATLEHTCQINFSYDGKAGKTAGLFARDTRGQVYVTHSGGIGGGRAGIGPSAFRDYLRMRRRPAEATISTPTGQSLSHLVLGALDAPELRANIARFVWLVADFKAHARGRPLPSQSHTTDTSLGQGPLLDPLVRKAVELHAMARAEAHYRKLGYAVKPTHTVAGELDFKCTRRGVEVRVEVKGTTGDGNSVELTAAEVRRAQLQRPTVQLAVVSRIEIDRTNRPPRASGGDLTIYKNFDPSQHRLLPTRYRCMLDPSHGE